MLIDTIETLFADIKTRRPYFLASFCFYLLTVLFYLFFFLFFGESSRDHKISSPDDETRILKEW